MLQKSPTKPKIHISVLILLNDKQKKNWYKNSAFYHFDIIININDLDSKNIKLDKNH